MSESNVIVLERAPSRTMARGQPFAVLDIGTAKICCAIARVTAADGVDVVSVGHQLAEGLRAGEIVDVEAVEASLLAALHEAEQRAGQTLREVVLGISAGRPHSRYATIEVDLGGRAVGKADLDVALRHAQAEARADGVEVLHALPLDVTLDGGPPLDAPCGLIGNRLGVVVHLVCVAEAPLNNLIAAVERCHLEVKAVIAGAYAAGLGALSADEANLGAIVLDMGAGVTGVARFESGRLREIHAVPLGGLHVTNDLGYGLATGRAQAERLKTLYGSVLQRAGDERRCLQIPGLGDPADPPSRVVTRAELTEIIRPRVEEIFQFVQLRLAHRPIPARARRLVLTGGASQIEGVVELAEEMFEMPVRLGRARPGANRAELGQTLDPAAGMTASGLITWMRQDDGGLTLRCARPQPLIAARLARLGQWLRENF